MAGQRVIRMDLAYEGTDFAGFNVQPGRRTVQSVLEGSWHSITGEAVRMTAAGRTDAGVHAVGQVVSVQTSSSMRPDGLLRALNARLPEDAVVRRLVEAPPSFDARRSAVRRHYRYTIWNQPVRNVRWRRYSLHVAAPLDLGRMQAATSALLGEHDFRAFAGRLSQSPPSSTRRTLISAEWSAGRDGFIHFDVAADGFLRHMVRGIVGTMLRIGRVQLSADELRQMLVGGERRAMGLTAPAHGLTLTRVDYDERVGM